MRVVFNDEELYFSPNSRGNLPLQTLEKYYGTDAALVYKLDDADTPVHAVNVSDNEVVLNPNINDYVVRKANKGAVKPESGKGNFLQTSYSKIKLELLQYLIITCRLMTIT